MQSMRVEEAKTKVCPFLLKQTAGGEINKSAKCICGDCMAWVFLQTHEQIENVEALKSNDKAMCATAYVDGKELHDDMKIGACLRLK